MEACTVGSLSCYELPRGTTELRRNYDEELQDKKVIIDLSDLTFEKPIPILLSPNVEGDKNKMSRRRRRSPVSDKKQKNRPSENNGNKKFVFMLGSW